MDDILHFLEAGEGPLAYAVLGLAAVIEYVFPPFPGDTITLFGAFLAARRGYHAAAVLATLTFGSSAGCMIAYGVGRRIGARRAGSVPRWLRGQQARRAVDLAIERFRRHGAVYLAINRFLPALRAFFFVAAGMAGLRPLPVLAWGTFSALLWNGLIMIVAYTVGASWERLVGFARVYGVLGWGVVVVVVVAVVARWAWRRRLRRPGAASPRPPSETAEDAREPGDEPRD